MTPLLGATYSDIPWENSLISQQFVRNKIFLQQKLFLTKFLLKPEAREVTMSLWFFACV